MAAFPACRHRSRAGGASVALVAVALLSPRFLPAQTTAPAKPAASAAPAPSWADEVLKKEAYVTPPPELAEAVLAPRHQNVTLTNPSPDKTRFLGLVGDGPVPMAVFSRPFHELGGVFVDFKANRARALTVSNGVGIQIVSAADGTKKAVAIPPGARVSNPTWSPDGATIAYYVHTDTATHIWTTDLATNTPRQATPVPVLATIVTSFDFTKDGKQIAAVLVPDGRPPMLPPPVAPGGPQVKVQDEQDRNRLRTFPSLMSTPYELQLLEWHTTGQVALIDVAAPAAKATRAAKPRKPGSGAIQGVRKIGQPAMVRAVDVSPDGQYVRVTRLAKPFSYIVPVSNFGSVEEVWALDSKPLAKVMDRPLNLGTQDDAQPPDPAAGVVTR